MKEKRLGKPYEDKNQEQIQNVYKNISSKNYEKAKEVIQKEGGAAGVPCITLRILIRFHKRSL